LFQQLNDSVNEVLQKAESVGNLLKDSINNELNQVVADVSSAIEGAAQNAVSLFSFPDLSNIGAEVSACIEAEVRNLSVIVDDASK
jgi:hypothetical protein